MQNNIITNNKDELIGYFADIFNYLKEEFITEIKNNNFGVISPDWLELLEDVKKYEEYDGLLIVSDHNGMGWTATKYQGEAEDLKMRLDRATEDLAFWISNNLDNIEKEPPIIFKDSKLQERVIDLAKRFNKGDA